MQEEKTKSLPISKRMVYNSYLKVCDKNGGAGIDKQSIEMFDEVIFQQQYVRYLFQRSKAVYVRWAYPR